MGWKEEMGAYVIILLSLEEEGMLVGVEPSSISSRGWPGTVSGQESYLL